MPLHHSHSQKNRSTELLEIQLLNWSEAESQARTIRQIVFIEEQLVPEADEWGHGDETALHLIAKLNDKPVATARLTADGKIGRMAVLNNYRQQGIGLAMLTKLIKVAKQRKLKQLELNAQTHAQAFYSKQGFIACGNEFLDAGIPHIRMILVLD